MSRLTIVVATMLVAASLVACEHDAPAAKSVSSIEQRFEAAKTNRPELIAFLREMPLGADLHHHLDGSTFSEFILRSARERGLNYDLSTHMFTSEPVGNNIISAADLSTSFLEISEYRDHFSMRGWHPNTGNGRDHFFSIFRRIGSSGRIPQGMLAEVKRRNALQNVQYLETISPVVPASLRTSVNDHLTSFDISDLESAYAQIVGELEADNYAATIAARIDTWEGEAEAIMQTGPALPPGIVYPDVTFVPYVLRMGPVRDFFVAVATSMAAINADERVVAMTIVGPEDLPDSNENFKAHMKIMDFLWRKMGQPRVTLHAGELVPEEATLVDMSDRIRSSIDVGHARRIGHGVSIGRENDSAGLLAQMAADKTLVEICLTSNEVILGIAGDEHPFQMYRRAGVPVSLATDDEGISRSPLTMEFVKAVERYDLGYADVKELARNSLEYAFLSGESLFVDGDFGSPRPEFAGLWDSTWRPSPSAQQLIEENARLRKQLELERAFVAFEEGPSMHYEFQSSDTTIPSRGGQVPATLVEPIAASALYAWIFPAA